MWDRLILRYWFISIEMKCLYFIWNKQQFQQIRMYEWWWFCKTKKYENTKRHSLFVAQVARSFFNMYSFSSVFYVNINNFFQIYYVIAVWAEEKLFKSHPHNMDPCDPSFQFNQKICGSIIVNKPFDRCYFFDFSMLYIHATIRKVPLKNKKNENNKKKSI